MIRAATARQGSLDRNAQRGGLAEDAGAVGQRMKWRARDSFSRAVCRVSVMESADVMRMISLMVAGLSLGRSQRSNNSKPPDPAATLRIVQRPRVETTSRAV